MTRRHAAFALAALPLAGCGYHVTGRADLLPKNLKTIAIPAFGNVTARYRLSERLPQNLTREFVRRTRYQIIADPTQADAILNGSVIMVHSFPTVFDQRTGRAAGIQLVAIMSIKLTERATGKVLYERPQFEFRQRYEIAVPPQDPNASPSAQLSYFEESSTAIERMARDVSQQIVAAVLEAF